MRNKSKKVYDKVRILNLYAFAFFILFILQKYSLGLLFGSNGIVMLEDRLQNVLFTISSLVIIKLFVKASVPSEEYSQHFFTAKRIRHNQ